MQVDALGLTHCIRLPEPDRRAATYVAQVDELEWTRVATRIREHGGQFLSLWARDDAAGTGVVSAAFLLDDALLWVQLPLGEMPAGSRDFPDLSAIFPAAVRMQRAVFDLVGLRARGAGDTRPWLDHGHWPQDRHPLRRRHAPDEPPAAGERSDEAQPAPAYPFVNVAGEGVHEIAVGPIHAGIIEPGHFRFSVVGEKVLRLEERFGYCHRGVERLFEGTALGEAQRIAARVAGDSTVAFSWAYCMALEQALEVRIPRRALTLRALMLERERVANHLGDLGALGNDAGFAYGLAQCSRMKEEWLRLNARVFGHRYQMDRIVPGGVCVDMTAESAAAMSRQCDAIGQGLRTIQRIYDEQSGLQDRFGGTGRLTRELVEHFGVYGLAARASGRAGDARIDLPYAPYDGLAVRMALDTRGDVAARVAVRFAEAFESLRLIERLLHDLPQGDIVAPIVPRETAACGTGWVEGWRGGIFVALETDDGRVVSRCHCHDPSWQTWPALECAIIGNIVPDFPLINKSFNLNYAGHDL